MNESKNDKGKKINSIRYYEERTVASNNYLTDEELEKLIAAVENEPLLRPPKEFKADIIRQIHMKRKRKKNRELFLYSMKVIAATAAALIIMIIVPENILPEGNDQTTQIPEWQVESDRNLLQWELQEDGEEYFGYRLDEYCFQLNEGLNRLVNMEVLE